tara:strand:+ start:201 stop:758 length:558 start_codon:yes stop_codon:yes gene_type:complete
MKHKTINANFKLEKGKDLDFKYQEELTEKLDETNSKFTQAILNEIVLWKVNRYALFNSTLINEINTISSWKVLNEEKTRELLTSLLKIKGVQLAMASTILRFRNPNIFQIIDKRAYRVINKGKTLKLTPIKDTSRLKTIDHQIDLYLEYLEKIKNVSKILNISFCHADRVLYNIDKRINKSVKIN